MNCGSSSLLILGLQLVFHFQMALLLMFEKTDSYKLDELEKATQIAKDQFIKNVQSLLESKLLVSKYIIQLFIIHKGTGSRGGEG